MCATCDTLISLKLISCLYHRSLVPPLSVVSSPPPPGLLSAPPGLTRPPSLLNSPPPAVSAPHYSTFFGSPAQVNTAAAPTQRFDQTNYLPLSNISSSFPNTPMQYSSQEAPFVPQLQPMGIYHQSVTPTAAASPNPATKKGNVFDMFDLRPELLPPTSNKLSFSSQRPLVYRDSSNAYTSTSLPSNAPRPVKSTDMKYPRGKFMSPSDVR